MSNSAQAMTPSNGELRRFFAASSALYNQVCANRRVLCQANSVAYRSIIRATAGHTSFIG